MKLCFCLTLIQFARSNCSCCLKISNRIAWLCIWETIIQCLPLIRNYFIMHRFHFSRPERVRNFYIFSFYCLHTRPFCQRTAAFIIYCYAFLFIPKSSSATLSIFSSINWYYLYSSSSFAQKSAQRTAFFQPFSFCFLFVSPIDGINERCSCQLARISSLFFQYPVARPAR